MSAQLTGPTVYWWFRRFVRLLLFRTIHDVALMLDREQAGRESSPSAGILDSQSIKAPHGATRGYDAGKKVLGRKRHIAVDTDGRLLMVNLTSAAISDSTGAQAIPAAIRKRRPWLKHLFADGACDRGRLMSKAAFLDFVVEIVRRTDREPAFKLLPRTLGGLLTAVPSGSGSSVCRRMMGRRAHLRLDGPLAPPGARP
jgi:putative transposase